MATTTQYGSWNYVTGALGSAGVEGYVTDYLGAFGDEYDTGGLAAAFRAAVNKQMSRDRKIAGVSLHGDEFYGPHPIPEDAGERINSAIDRVDLGRLAERFDRSR